jgi:hypothetical protein
MELAKQSEGLVITKVTNNSTGYQVKNMVNYVIEWSLNCANIISVAHVSNLCTITK